MAVDKLVDSTQLDADLTSVANAIRTKGGTSAQLAFPAGFVSAIQAISGGGGGGSDSYEIVDGTFTLASAGKSKSLSISFQPEHFIVYALIDDPDYPTDTTWKTAAGFMSVFGQAWWVINRNGTTTQGTTRTASNHSYSDGTFTFSFNYNMPANVTFYWLAWRAKT